VGPSTKHGASRRNMLQDSLFSRGLSIAVRTQKVGRVMRLSLFAYRSVSPSPSAIPRSAAPHASESAPLAAPLRDS
jgi:hypothetical protein